MKPPSLPFIYSDIFIIISLVVIGVLAVVCLVLLPLTLLKKTPNPYPRVEFDSQTRIVKLNDDLSPIFSLISVQTPYLTFKCAKGITGARVSICFTASHGTKLYTYVLDFTESETVRINFPAGAYIVNYIVPVDEEGLDKNGLALESVKKSHLLGYSIAVGIAVAVSIFLLVLILSTHLRKVNNAFIGFYFLAALGVALIPAIYFFAKFMLKRGEKGGK